MPAEDIDWSALDDNQFVHKAADTIWMSAYANNNPKAPAHKQADAAHEEAERRGKPYLYQRAWNKAFRLAGHTPSESDLEAAKAPEHRTQAPAEQD